MNLSGKRIKKYNEPNGLNGLYDAGYSPNEIKEAVVNELQYMFDNVDIRTEDLKADFLTVFHLHASSLSTIEDHKFICLGILEIYRAAFICDSLRVVEAISRWSKDISKGLSKHWTLVYTFEKEDDLSPYDRFENIMQSIGQMIEGIMLPQLKLLLTLSRIKRSKSISYETIEGLKLGNIIQELIDTENEYITRRLIDTITNNKLSVIRNICYHHNYEFNGGKYYLDKVDKAGKTRYEVSNEELQHLWNFVSLTNSFFRVAEISFIQDNLQFIQDNLPDDHYDNLQVREDINDFRFYTSMLGQGFQIVDAKETEELLKVTVKETRIDARYFERMIHSSQFLFHLHQVSDSVKYEIDYLTRDGILYSKVSAYRNEMDNLVNSGHKNSKLMHPHVVNFEFENKKFRQDVDVFKNLNQLKLNRFANHTFFAHH